MMRIAPQLVRTSALAGLVALTAATALQAQRPGPREPGRLRVCADPDNMPSSNEKGEGYENKLASLIGDELKSRVEYVWYPTRRGYFRIINGMYCDLALEAPAGLDMTGVTKPYFRSGYVFVARKGSGLEDITSLSDPRLKKLKIGVNVYTSDAENSPPAMALSHHGVVGNLTGYSTFFDDQNRPESIVNAVASKDVDIAIAWGPLAGYFAKSSTVPLVLTPLPARDSLSEFPFQYDIGIALRRRDKELRDSLQAVLERKRPAIEAILKEYGVPMLPLQAAGQERSTGATPPAPSDTAKRTGTG
jgi:mxaJ protein